jgi:hypothetical protein
MDQNPTNSAATAASPDSQWLEPLDLRAIANRPEHRDDQFFDCAPRVQAMAREILRMQEREEQLLGPVMAIERILNSLGIKTEAVMGLPPIDWIRQFAKRIGKDAQKRVDEIAEARKLLEQWLTLAPDLESLHLELFGKVDPNEPRVTQSAARVLREQREELDKIDDLLNIGEVPRGMRLDRLRTVIADRNGRRRQLVEAHDALDKAGCPLPRFDVVNGARLPERIAVIVKQRDRAQKKVGSESSYLDVFGSQANYEAYLKACRDAASPPYREHTPAQLAVDQAHQALTRHGVPDSFGIPTSKMTMVERIDWLAAAKGTELLRAEAMALRTLLFEVLVGMRNGPVQRAKDYLDKHGMPVPENTDTFESMREQRDNAHREVEKLRMQLATCGVLAVCNTPKSLAKHRVMHPDYECESVLAVIAAVEREIDLREEGIALRKEIANIKSFRAGDLLRTDAGGLLKLSTPGTIQSLRNDLAAASAKLAAIQQFTSPTAGSPTTGQIASTTKPAHG